MLAGGVAVASAAPLSPAGTCEKEGRKLAGKQPVVLGHRDRTPRKIRDVTPAYPEVAAGTVGRGMWIGEALVATDGKISHVWPIRKVEFAPPFLEFNQAIVDAIEQREFEPVIVGSEPVPVCITVTVSFNWG